MLGELLADNLRDYPARARVARVLHGSVVMTAADKDRSVTVRFGGPTIVVDEGAVAGAPSVAGEWLDLAQLCSGRLPPLRAVRSRRLQVSGFARPDLLAGVGYVMSVPASYYGGDVPVSRRPRVVIPVVLLIALLVVLTLLSAWRRR